MPNLHVVINFGGPIDLHNVYRAGPFAATVESSVIGTWNMGHIIDWPLTTQRIGICFKQVRLILPATSPHGTVRSVRAARCHLGAGRR